MEQTPDRIVDEIWSEVGSDVINAQKLMALANGGNRLSDSDLAKKLTKVETDADEFRVGLAESVRDCLLAGWDVWSIKRHLVNRCRQLSTSLASDASDMLSKGS